METTIFKELKVPLPDVPYLVDLMYSHGCRNIEVTYTSSVAATITFFDEEEYVICIIGDFLNRVKQESSLHVVELDLAFIRRIEKKLQVFDRYHGRPYRLGK